MSDLEEEASESGLPEESLVAEDVAEKTFKDLVCSPRASHEI